MSSSLLHTHTPSIIVSTISMFFHFCFVGSDGTGADTTPRSLTLPGGEFEDYVGEDDNDYVHEKKTPPSAFAVLEV